jgi:hypothetical protein
MKLPQNPIFIVGYPRSGTTLLQRLLVTQPGFFSFPETHYFCSIEKCLQLNETGNILISCLDNAIKKIHEKMEFRFTKEEIDTLYRLAQRNNLDSKRLFEYIVSRFLLNKHPVVECITSFRWIEKTPTHANYLNRIIEFYPDAQIIHVVRHPVPAVFSRKFKFPFNKQTPVADLARKWDVLVGNVELFTECFPGHVYTLRYEDLVEDLEKELQPTADFLNMQFDFSSISKIRQKLENNLESLFLPSETWKLDDVGHDIANTNPEYKNIISREDAAPVEEIAADKMKRYSYEPYFY